MKNSIVILFALIFLSACSTSPTIPAPTPTATSDPTLTPEPIPDRDTLGGRNHPLILAHFMSWYQAPPLGTWGGHWTGFGALDPDLTDDDGRHVLASQVYPLTGPYDSRDPDILEYQMLLMKIAGIDGVIVDWYGNKDIYDYGLIHEATRSTLSAAENAGLTFSVCYEDRTVTAMTAGDILKVGEVYDHGQETMQYLQDTWFQSSAWTYLGNRPLLFIFGPIYYTNASNWDTIFSELPKRPFFITLDNKVAGAADASYPWIPMHKASGGVLSPESWQAYLDAFYTRTKGDQLRIGAAFPQFHDIYAEIGTESSYGYMDPQDGETFRTSLQMAVDADVDIIQLITWNDYGEGTVIEPTVEFGYAYLEALQAQQITWQGDAFPYTADDLRLPLRILELRRASVDDGTLDLVVNALLTGNPTDAQAILKTLE